MSAINGTLPLFWAEKPQMTLKFFKNVSRILITKAADINYYLLPFSVWIQIIMRLFQKTNSMLLHKREADKTPKTQISKGNSSHEMYVCSIFFNIWFLYGNYEIWSFLVYFFWCWTSPVRQETNYQITKKKNNQRINKHFGAELPLLICVINYESK